MKNFLHKLDAFFDLLQRYILIVASVAVCLLIMASAAMRYIFKVDFYGSEEIILFVAFWLYFIGSANAAREGTHINANMMSMFVKSPKILKIFDLIKNGLSLAVAALVTYWCYNYVAWSWSLGAVSNVFKLPNVIGQLPIFISFVFWTIYLVRDVVEDITELKRLNQGGEETC